MNHYEVLGLSNSATFDEIKKRYHKLALQKHPTKEGMKTNSNGYQPRIKYSRI